MAGFTATAWIAAPPTVVFAILHDVNHFPTVLPGIIRAEQITPGSVGLGTRFHETRRINGREASAEIEVTTFAPPSHYAATSAQEGITATYHYTLMAEQQGGQPGTRINLQATASAAGWKKLLLPLVVGHMKKEDRAHLQRLKVVAERSPILA